MRKLATVMLIAASTIAIAGCEKKAETTVVTTETVAADATAAASEGTDADAAASEEGDPNGNPVKP